MNRLANLNFVLFAALSFFSFGTAMMDYFLVYPSRMIVGSSEFVAYHALLENAIIPISVIPFFIITILNIALFWLRPSGVTTLMVGASLVCLILDWASSILVQIPMNLQLNHGKDVMLIQAVMDTNWGRVALESMQALLVFAMILKALKKQ